MCHTCYTKADYAQTLAARFWFNNKKSIESIAKDKDISVDKIREIQKSTEYLAAVEKLIYTARSPRNILKWIESYRGNMPAEFGKRMGLSEEVVSELIERVERTLQGRKD